MGEEIVNEGDFVRVWISSTNRYEVFYDESFIPDRSPKPYPSFGSGTHPCHGSPLAKLEARIALE